MCCNHSQVKCSMLRTEQLIYTLAFFNQQVNEYDSALQLISIGAIIY